MGSRRFDPSAIGPELSRAEVSSYRGVFRNAEAVHVARLASLSYPARAECEMVARSDLSRLG